MKLADLKWITPLLQAQEEGKTIQFQNPATGNWENTTKTESFTLGENWYRIKPEEDNYDIYVFESKIQDSSLFALLNNKERKHTIKGYLESPNFKLLYIIPQTLKDHQNRIKAHATAKEHKEDPKQEEGRDLNNMLKQFIDSGEKLGQPSTVSETLNPVEILAKRGTTPIRFYIYFNFEEHLFKAHRNPLSDNDLKTNKFVVELCLDNKFLTDCRDMRPPKQNAKVD